MNYQKLTLTNYGRNTYSVIKLRWNYIEGASTYRLYGGTDIETLLLETHKTNYMATELTPNTTYHYQVRAYGRDEKEIAISNVIEAKTLEILPPQNVTLTPSSDQVEITFRPVKGATGYLVERNKVRLDDISFVDRYVEPDTKYAYRFRTLVNEHSSEPSPTYEVETLAQEMEGTVRAFNAGNGCIRIRWQIEGIYDQFLVYRATNPAGQFTQIGTTGGTALSYTDCKITPNVTYYYRIEAVEGTGPTVVVGVTDGTMIRLVNDTCCNQNYTLYIPQNVCNATLLPAGRNNTNYYY